ncbi:hypothetical protein EDB89DRAFT_2069465 [Lactarius sanguifluus]|nr:hypothetical protein EDB89DRAFT_2069465 [Lactarius sanguifluus]
MAHGPPLFVTSHESPCSLIPVIIPGLHCLSSSSCVMRGPSRVGPPSSALSPPFPHSPICYDRPSWSPSFSECWVVLLAVTSFSAFFATSPSLPFPIRSSTIRPTACRYLQCLVLATVTAPLSPLFLTPCASATYVTAPSPTRSPCPPPANPLFAATCKGRHASIPLPALPLPLFVASPRRPHPPPVITCEVCEWREFPPSHLPAHPAACSTCASNSPSLAPTPRRTRFVFSLFRALGAAFNNHYSPCLGAVCSFCLSATDALLAITCQRDRHLHLLLLTSPACCRHRLLSSAACPTCPPFTSPPSPSLVLPLLPIPPTSLAVLSPLGTFFLFLLPLSATPSLSLLSSPRLPAVSTPSHLTALAIAPFFL